MDLKGKTIAVFVDNMYQELELWYPYFRFQEAGAQCVLVGSEAGRTFTSKLGYPAKAEMSYDQIDASRFDGVVVPGGFAPDYIRRHKKATEFVHALNEQGKVVAAICHGLWVLCSSDMLRGRRATCFCAIKDDVINAGARYSDAEVVVDGNLITSRKPEDLPAFCREAMKAMAEAPALAHRS